jgi:hypothetical protein
MAKELDCPNCGPGHKLVPKANGDGVCATCNGTFTPGPEPKLVAIGEFDEMKGRVDKLEADNAELRALLGKPADEPPAETPTHEEDDDV